ncbi:MAG: hypothetical protein EXQ96_06220 [Alphaproteobacteria bacterium]|nr:hypothetical protein [Alphaproteobacteria bacterium]
MSEGARKNIFRMLNAVSFILILKGAVGGSIALLALFGVSVPFLGIEVTPVKEGIVAGIGAVLGVIAAFRA